jgi:hypothetical protein
LSLGFFALLVCDHLHIQVEHVAVAATTTANFVVIQLKTEKSQQEVEKI